MADNGGGAGGVPYAGGIGDNPTGNSGWGNFNWGNALGDLGDIFSGFEGQSSNPFSAAMGQYQKWAQQGANAMSPFMQAGAGEIPSYQNWLKSMSNPTQFTNNLMANYQESPNAKFMQQQAIRSAQNAGSATGMNNSSPMNMQIEQNAGNISQQDMQNWMQNVLGINTEYGQGMGNLINNGEQAGNSLMNLYGNEANAMGESALGQQEGENQDTNNEFGGIENLAEDFFNI